MSNETKTPQADEWWVNSKGYIRYIIGLKRSGSIVWEDSTGWSFANDNSDWNDWHHEPRCTGFDWTEPPAIDPGEGWELLPVGTVLEEGDEYESGGDWNKTCYPGTKNIKGWTYRRRKPPSEVWPKYYVTILNSDGYYHCVSESEVWHICSAEIVRQSAKAQTLTNKYVWREVTESEAKARVKPADHLPALIPGIATDRMVDLFLSWRLPSDFQPDGGISFTSRSIHENWPTGTNLFTATQARRMIEHLLSVPEETSRVQPAEPIDQATKALHELAVDAGIEETRRPVAAERVPDHRPAREVIREIVRLIADSSMTDEESADMAFQIGKQWLDDNPEDPPPFAKPFTDPRSGMGIQKDHVSWRPNGQRHEVATEVTYHAEKIIESPDDWVTQDRVPARPGIDERRYHYSSGDISAWADSACMDWNRPVVNRAPIKHLGGWVELRCRRRDFPAPQPKTIDVSPGEGWRWVEKDEPWQEGDDCLICDFKHSHTHNCQCWRRRIVPQPKRTPVRLFRKHYSGEVVAVIDGDDDPINLCNEADEINLDGSGFCVKGGE